MGDNPLSPNSTSPRKLPIPGPGISANANSALKGILIKPKRILPSQPDNQKLKRPIHENGSECKLEDVSSDITTPGIRAACQKGDGATVNACAAVGPKVIVPKLQIDVTKLKTFFQLKGSAVGKNDKRKTDLNENDIYAEEKETTEDSSASIERIGVNQPLVLKDNTVYSSAKRVKEWCSARGVGQGSGKMASDQPEQKSMERGIRSPSPKSNTTWDRSSSGYSSDERADPRSPPPSHSASVSVSSKTETEVTYEDDVIISQSADITEDKTDTEEDNDEDTLKFKDESNSDSLNLFSTSTSIDDMLTSTNECNVVTLTPTPAGVEADSTGELCEHCDSVNNQSADKNDTTGSCVNFSFDNSLSVRQPNYRRPVWTAASTSPGNGRIQYRKSVSESTISLRHPSRQGISDSNYDGLAVCGKSFPQHASNTTIANSVTCNTNNNIGLAGVSAPSKPDIIVVDAAKGDVGAHNELLSPTSAFTLVERPVRHVELGAASNGTDIAAATRTNGFRLPQPTCRSPRDFRSMGFQMNGKLFLSQMILIGLTVFVDTVLIISGMLGSVLRILKRHKKRKQSTELNTNKTKQNQTNNIKRERDTFRTLNCI